MGIDFQTTALLKLLNWELITYGGWIYKYAKAIDNGN